MRSLSGFGEASSRRDAPAETTKVSASIRSKSVPPGAGRDDDAAVTLEWPAPRGCAPPPRRARPACRRTADGREREAGVLTAALPTRLTVAATVRAVVTGATGFLGSRLARQLVDRGDDVCVLVRTTSDLRRLDGLDLETSPGDVTDRASVIRAMAGADVVFHCAALVELGPPDRTRLEEVNVGGTRDVLEAAAEQGALAVHVSSVSALGPTGPTPSGRDLVVARTAPRALRADQARGTSARPVVRRAGRGRSHRHPRRDLRPRRREFDGRADRGVRHAIRRRSATCPSSCSRSSTWTTARPDCA